MTAHGTRRPQEGQCRFCDLGRRGHREGCPQVEIDAVTARALAAESRLSVPATSAALDAFRANRAATHVCEHGSLARKCGDCDSVESGLEAGAWQARALAAEESVEVCNAMISQLIGDREIDEARGRAHGLLAAAWHIGSVADSIDGTTVDPAAQRAMREAERLIAALTTEADNAG